MKKRVTLSLDESLLKSLASTIAQGKHSNRSSAVEAILTAALTPPVRKAVVLAGGKEMKMPGRKAEIPIPLVPVEGRPLLEHILELLRRYLLSDVILAIGRDSQRLIRHFGSGERFGINLRYSQEDDSLGTAGALKRAEPLFTGETVLVIHGDILTNISLSDFIAFHREVRSLATLAIKPRPYSQKYGKVLMSGSRITDFFQRPKIQGVSLVNTGIYLLEPELLSRIPEGKSVYLEQEIFPRLAKEGRLSGYPFQGAWFDISTPHNYAEALARWKKEKQGRR